MLNFLLQPLADFVISLISKLSYPGVFLTMTIQSAGIPLPSEVTMPFAGFLVASGQFDFWPTVLFGTFGCLTGAIISYIIGFYGGEPFVLYLIKKYGKFFLISVKDFNQAKKWFERYDELIIFASRVLPVIRTFISLPAGIAHMDFKKFFLYTLAGSFISTLVLVFLGFKLGDDWGSMGKYFEKLDIFIILAGLAVAVWCIKYKLKNQK